MPNNYISQIRSGYSGPLDPYFAQVSALLKMDSTPFADVKGHTVDVLNVGFTTINTNYGGSAVFNGIDSSIRIPAAADLVMGTGDFTQEIYVKLAAYPASQGIIFTNAPPSGVENANNSLGINIMAGGNVRVQSSYAVFITGSTVLPLNNEIHLAISRVSGTMRLFVNGVLDGSVASAHDFSLLSQVMIGKEAYNSNNVGASLNGWVDEFRITKGVGRYVNNFAVPGAFPPA